MWHFKFSFISHTQYAKMHLGLILGVVINNKPPQSIMSFHRAFSLLVRYNNVLYQQYNYL